MRVKKETDRQASQIEKNCVSVQLAQLPPFVVTPTHLYPFHLRI